MAPTLTVVGNCQAESTRKLLHSTGLFNSQRITPVHELTEQDMGWFGELISRTDILVTQPIRDNYRGLPVGSSQLAAALPAGARTVFYPVMRFDALTPYQAIIRDPDDPSLDPPIIPYHDLRIFAAAVRGEDHPVTPQPAAGAYTDKLEETIAQMRTREQQVGEDIVPMSDYLATVPVWHTINHPDNATMVELARRILAHLGLDGDPTPPDYEMLGELDSMIDPHAAAALGATDRVPPHREVWTRRDHGEIPFDEISAAHLEFYASRPGIIDAGLARHRERMEQFGLL